MLEPCEIVCKDCGQTFSFTDEQAKFFNDKGFTNLPKRCKSCSSLRKVGQTQRTYTPREDHEATCSSCGKSCTVPFEPKEGRAVYCRDCFLAQKNK